jgi:predicted CXXCH cytochrome family protein
MRAAISSIVKTHKIRLFGISAGLVALCLCLLIFSSASGAGPTIVSTKHNLSVSGPGDIKSLTETRICVFCHTPHNATPKTPLWNKATQPTTYVLYSSTTLRAALRQPFGPTRLCLSCHDGTVALGAVLQPSEGIAMTTTTIPLGRASYIGTYLGGDHPVAFSYYDSLSNPEINPALPSSLVFYYGGTVHCTTCHDPHEDRYQSPDRTGFLTGKFLLVNNRNSALCTLCHIKTGWSTSSHATSTAQTNGVLPVTPRNWPTWLTVGEWGCESCHVSHSGSSKQWLLYYTKEEDNCYSCHKGNVAQKNIYAQFQKFSHHSVEYATGVHSPAESPLLITNHVECDDCHNPHTVSNATASAPFISGKLTSVSGVDLSGTAIKPAIYEYQICFKCHADSTPSILFSPGYPLPRVVNTTNLRTKFNNVNPSYHPVVNIGKLTTLPSMPSPYTPTLTATSTVYCTDCHDSDESSSAGGTGPRGPHGSIYPPILLVQYMTTDNTMESFQNYALCYRCHNRDIVLSTQSFKKHQTHVVNDLAPCSVCHDPHGVPSDAGVSGSHTHLINFNVAIVKPVTGQVYPLYNDNGNGTGSCTLVCHGVTHTNMSY